MSKDKIALIVSASASIKGFRYHLIQKLKEEYEVFVVAFDDIYRSFADELGISLYSVNASNRATGIKENFFLVSQIQKAIEQISPDIVFTFQLKPNTYGVIAAHNAGVKRIYSMVEGAGDPFINTGIKWSFIRFVVCSLYKRSLKYVDKVIFLNKDDQKEFIGRKLVEADSTLVIPGIGVDVEHFAFKPIKNYKNILMIARMLKTKGVLDYCQVAREVRKTHPDVTFSYLGAEGTLKLYDIQEYIEDGSIMYLGVTEDVRPYLENCLLLLLSSYREGLPMSIMEAEAVGRAIITTDNIGCRDSIEDGYNGFLVKIHDIPSFVDKVNYLIDNPEKAAEFGRNSRELAERKFDHRKINEQIIDLLKKK